MSNEYSKKTKIVSDELPKIDLTGQVIKHWRILNFAYKAIWSSNQHSCYWNVECINCGSQSTKQDSYLFSSCVRNCKNCNKIKSLKQLASMENLDSDVYGSWRVLGLHSQSSARQASGSRSGRTRTRNIYQVQCVNCGFTRLSTIDNIKLTVDKGYQCQNCMGRPQGEAGCRILFSQYLASSKKTKREFSLTLEEFKTLTSGNCHYCSAPPSLLRTGAGSKSPDSWGAYYYNGIDRKDNNKGYVMSNCVTCCIFCNRAKNNIKYDLFKNYICRIVSKAKEGLLDHLLLEKADEE